MIKYRTAMIFIFLPCLLLGCGDGPRRPVKMEGFPWPDPANGTVAEVPTDTRTEAIDGDLNDEAWIDAGRIEQFYRPSDASPAKTKAAARLYCDGTSLILSFDLPEPRASAEKEPDRCFLSPEYQLLGSGPTIRVLLDPAHEHGVYYQFVLDPAGRRQDLRVFDESWSADWTAACKVNEGRWTAEMAIPIKDISPDGTDDGDLWGVNIILSGVGREGGLSSTPIKIDLVDAERFGHLIFKGDLSEDKLSQIKDSLPALHADQKQNRLAANEQMCGPELKIIGSEINNLAPGTELKLKDGSTVTCLGLENPKIVRSPYPFLYEKYENEQLTRLRETYKFDRIAAAGENEFEELLILNHWLVENVEFGSPAPIRPAAHHVLETGLKGQTFNCTYLSFTLMQIYQSVGFTARKLTSVGHGTLDVWANYWKKWIQIDPSRDSYFRMDGVPLNSGEVRREFWRNQGVDMEMVYGTEQRSERVTLERRARDGAYKYRQDGYAWIAYKTRNNFFEVPYAYRNFLYLIHEDEYNRGKEWISAGQTDQRYLFGFKTNRFGDIFWTLNQAFIHVYDSGDGNLTVQLETVTPNFERFEVALDDGDWTAADPVLTWELHPGQNFLHARTVNKFGRLGPEHKVVLGVPEAGD
ncbi:hypothetical protein ACFLT7_04980 [candidate division KSB1 bacterium]